MRRTALKGHALRSEGAAYRREDGAGRWVFERRWQTGVALCECGETSPVLGSNGKRKAWHAGHKEEIRRG